MKLIEEGFNLIKKFEGFSPKSYICPAGCPTIGYGHKIKPNEQYESISEEEASLLLGQDVTRAMVSVVRNIQFPLNKYQFASLVSFTYNLGAAALQRSTLRQKINYGEFVSVQSEMLRWVYARGRKVRGLVRRRLAEVELFYRC